MKLPNDYGVRVACLSGAVAVLSAGFFAHPVHASGCRSVACTFYVGSTPQDGMCGTAFSGNCVCTYGGQGQTQAACNS
jgi:hypothetical protein